MRTITTNWNNSAYNSATTFLDKATGTSSEGLFLCCFIKTL